MTLVLAGPALGSWVLPGTGSAAQTAAALGTPSALRQSAATTSSVTLSWTAPSGPAPDAYEVSRNGVPTSCTPVSPTSCTDTGLTAGTTYSYTVTAALQRWRSRASATVPGTTTAPAPADATPPVVRSVDRADATPTAAPTVTWTVVFSEPVTGVGTADVALVPTGVTGARVTGVGGSGTTWTVTASTGTGGGSLGLNVLDDDSVQDAAGNPLAGPGTGNGAFAGQTYALDRSAPTVTVNQRSGQADPTNSASLGWTVVFSKPVTGFDVDDLVRTSGTGGTLSVSGTGPTYDVVLAGPLTDGAYALSVRAGAATDSTNAALTSLASTSTDATITYDGTRPTIRTATEASAQGNRETFSGTTSERGGTVVVTVVQSSTGAVVRTLTASVGTTATGGSYAWTVTTANPQDLAAGTSYGFSAAHTDAAGNASAPFPGATFTGN